MQNIVKIKGVVLEKIFLVSAINPSDNPFKVALAGNVVLDFHKLSFGFRNHRQHRPGIELLGADLVFFHYFLHQRPLVRVVINHKIFFISDFVDFGPQNPHANMMKSSHPGLKTEIADQQFLYPFFHFFGRFVRESNREYLTRTDFFLLDQIGDSVDKQPRFSASRTRHDQNRPFRREHRFPLLFVEALDYFHTR